MLGPRLDVEDQRDQPMELLDAVRVPVGKEPHRRRWRQILGCDRRLRRGWLGRRPAPIEEAAEDGACRQSSSVGDPLTEVSVSGLGFLWDDDNCSCMKAAMLGFDSDLGNGFSSAITFVSFTSPSTDLSSSDSDGA